MTKEIVFNSIVATGYSGQIGLNGDLPWRGDYKLAASMKHDLKIFATLTADSLLICGRKTYETIKHLDGTYGRSILYISAKEDGHSIDDILTAAKASNYAQAWIVGGSMAYEALDHLISVTRGLRVITRLEYTGPADTYYGE